MFGASFSGLSRNATGPYMHRAAIASLVEERLPNPDWAGVGIFDWEDWRPLYDTNYDSLSSYQEYSQRLVRAEQPTLNASQVVAEAERQFNEGAREIFLLTLRTAQSLRPKGQWGFYQYPYFSHDRALMWLWAEVDVLLPSLYSRDAADATTGVNDSLVVAEMVQAATGIRPLILPYLWLWPHTRLLSPGLLDAGVQVSAALGADGLILWGSYSDVCRGESGGGDNSTLCTQCGQCSTTMPVTPNIKGSCENISGFLNGSAGALLARCKDYAEHCAAAACSDHGRCSRNVSAELGCSAGGKPATCICDPGWGGLRCETPVLPCVQLGKAYCTSDADCCPQNYPARCDPHSHVCEQKYAVFSVEGIWATPEGLRDAKRVLPPVSSNRTAVAPSSAPSSVLPAAAACAHCTIMAPWNFDGPGGGNPVDWPVKFVNLQFDIQFQAFGPAYNDSAHPLAVGSVKAAYTNRKLAAVGNLLMADHIFWSWLAKNPDGSGACGLVDGVHGMMCPNWRERWRAIHAALKPYIANGTYEGVFLGDELLDSGLPLSNLSSAAKLVRETWPDAVIYVNEGFNVLVSGGFNGGQYDKNKPHTVANGWVSDNEDWKLPAELDVISMDYYCTLRTCRGGFPCPVGLDGPGSGPVYDLSYDRNCTALIRGVYNKYLYTRIPSSATTRVLLVPAAQASAGRSAPCKGFTGHECDNPLNASVDAYDAYFSQQALDMWAWAVEDKNVAGFAPFHFADEPSYGPRDAIGFRNMPKTLSVWTEIGLKVIRAIPGATTLRERLLAATALKTNDVLDKVDRTPYTILSTCE
jgi:hyaluronoglucosaminidase